MKKQVSANHSAGESAGPFRNRLESGEPLQAGMLAVSRAGHDKGTLYAVLASEGQYLWLADGKRRTLSNPKKKKKMHVQVITHLSPELLELMQEIRLDAHVRRILKLYGMSGEQENNEYSQD